MESDARTKAVASTQPGGGAEGSPKPSGEPPAQGYSFFQMFFVPMLIASVLTGVILFFGLIGRETRNVRQFLDEIRMGGEHQRYQAAYELAFQLQKRQEPVNEEDQRLAIQIFEESRPDDTKIRGYLALALGQMKSRAAVPALVKALDDTSAQTRIYALMALGTIGDPSAEEAISRRLADEDEGIRKAAAFALGGVGGDLAKAELRKTLHDPTIDVSWNSALSLARLGDSAGKDVLLTMLDRDRIAGTPGISEEQVADVLEGAAKAAAMLKIAESAPMLKKLSEVDPDHKVRQAARDGLASIGASP